MTVGAAAVYLMGAILSTGKRFDNSDDRSELERTITSCRIIADKLLRDDEKEIAEDFNVRDIFTVDEIKQAISQIPLTQADIDSFWVLGRRKAAKRARRVEPEQVEIVDDSFNEETDQPAMSGSTTGLTRLDTLPEPSNTISMPMTPQEAFPQPIPSDLPGSQSFNVTIPAGTIPTTDEQNAFMDAIMASENAAAGNLERDFGTEETEDYTDFEFVDDVTNTQTGNTEQDENTGGVNSNEQD